MKGHINRRQPSLFRQAKREFEPWQRQPWKGASPPHEKKEPGIAAGPRCNMISKIPHRCGRGLSEVVISLVVTVVVDRLVVPGADHVNAEIIDIGL